jgi:hypothetical protein
MVSNAVTHLDDNSQQAIRDFIGLSLRAKEVLVSCNVISTLHQQATTKLVSSRDISITMQDKVRQACGEFPSAFDHAAVVETSTLGITEVGTTMAAMRSHMQHAHDLFVALVFQTEQVIARAQMVERSSSQFLKVREQAASSDRVETREQAASFDRAVACS